MSSTLTLHNAAEHGTVQTRIDFYVLPADLFSSWDPKQDKVSTKNSNDSSRILPMIINNAFGPNNYWRRRFIATFPYKVRPSPETGDENSQWEKENFTVCSNCRLSLFVPVWHSDRKTADLKAGQLTEVTEGKVPGARQDMCSANRRHRREK